MSFRAVADNVLVVLDRCEIERMASGLYKPATETTPIEARLATVLAVGPGVPDLQRLRPERRTVPVDASPLVGSGWIPMETSVGDRVLLESRDGGDRVPVEVLVGLGLDPERHYRIVRECEIAAVLEPDDGPMQV